VKDGKLVRRVNEDLNLGLGRETRAEGTGRKLKCQLETFKVPTHNITNKPKEEISEEKKRSMKEMTYVVYTNERSV
jgi:hypothetical protein